MYGMSTEKSMHLQDLPPKGLGGSNWMREHPIAVIGLLIGVHAIAGIVLAFFSADPPAVSSALFLSLIFCQTSLLGMWCGLGTSHWLLRLVGLIVGAGGLAIMLGAGIGKLSGEIISVVVAAVLLVAAVTWIVRWLKGAMQQIPDSTPDAREGLQFTIRHLLVLTFVVACLVTIGKALAPRLPHFHDVTMLSAIAVCFVSVALVAIWAILGLGQVLFRSLVLFVISAIVGWILARVIDEGDDIFWTSTTILQATYLMGSLLAIRACGYRFLARHRNNQCRSFLCELRASA